MKKTRLCHTWRSIRFVFPIIPVPHFPVSHFQRPLAYSVTGNYKQNTGNNTDTHTMKRQAWRLTSVPNRAKCSLILAMLFMSWGTRLNSRVVFDVYFCLSDHDVTTTNQTNHHADHV